MSDQQPLLPYPDDAARREWEAYLGQSQIERPPSIRTAVLLMRVGAAVSFVSILVSLVMLRSLKGDIKDRLRAENTRFSESDVDAAFTAAVVIGVVLGLIGVALWLWMAAKNDKGRRWARVVATVLSAISVLSLLVNAASPDATASGTFFSLAMVLLGVAAVVFLYRSDSGRYYTSMSKRR
jgi:uncharacterized membrane protein HdeD (DUF308 family)